MKILKCHIENFGKLQNFNYEFNSSFNEIIENNGWGKTTFSVFIKSMFYGLADTKRNVKENERTKYSPWQGGNFGGNIEFEVNGENYKLERFFGKKESEDTFSLIDMKTGKQSKKYSSNIGIELFDLDADAYERSTYIPQKEITNGINDKISSKLINMIQGTNNPDSFENAKKIIKTRMTELKKRGGSGLIADCEADISKVSEDIDTLKTSAEHIDEFQNKINNENEFIDNLEKEKEQITKQIKDYSKNQKVIANQKYISEMEQKIFNLKSRIDKNMKILNGNRINHEELKSIQEKETTKLSNLKQLENLKEEINEIPEELIILFKTHETSNSEIDKVINKVNEKNELSSELALSNQPKEIYSAPSKKISNKPVFISLSIAVILALFGIIFIFSNIPVSISLFVISIICIIVSGFIYFKNYIEVKTSSPIIINQTDTNEETVKKLTEKIKLLDEETNEFISHYSNDIINDKIAFLYDLKSKLEKYNNNLNKQKLDNEKLEKLNMIINNSDNEINSYFNKFNVDNNLSNEDKFTLIKTTFINLENDELELSKTMSSLDEFKEENSLEDISSNQIKNIDIDNLQNQEKNLQFQIDEHKEIKIKNTKNIDSIRDQLSELDEYEENLESLKLKESELKQEYKVLDLANNFLEIANDNLSSKYLNPMQNNLNKYMKLLLKENYQGLNFDTDLKVSFETYGKSRELDYLSKGLQEVVDVCIRFSLIDVLFEKEKPFIILDDPFVNMDKSKLENAVKLIKDISDTYQIIYLICHESRK